MVTTIITETTDIERRPISRWRLNSPFFQTFLICVTMFCGPGMNVAVLGLGAGGSHPSNIPIVDRLNIVANSLIAAIALVGGSIINKLGPRPALIFGASGFPLYIGALWYIDEGEGVAFLYFAAVYHGISAAVYYPTAGYVVTAYSPEHERGKYIGFSWMAYAAGSIVGSSIVLGMTTSREPHSSGVAQSVYISIICIQSLGVCVAALLADPKTITRNDGRPIARFAHLTWKGELRGLTTTFIDLRLMLVALALFSCKTSYVFSASVNATYYNARTRSLVNLIYWTTAAGVSALGGWFFDARGIGHRRRRELVAAVPTMVLILGSWASLFWFMASHSAAIDRSQKHAGIDWTDGSTFTALLVPYTLLACNSALSIVYLHWICCSFSNQPYVLARVNGLLDAIRALGVATAAGVDSNKVAFMTEGLVFFSLQVVGTIFAVASILIFGEDTNYGHEDSVIPPLKFEANSGVLPHNTDVTSCEAGISSGTA